MPTHNAFHQTIDAHAEVLPGDHDALACGQSERPTEPQRATFRGIAHALRAEPQGAIWATVEHTGGGCLAVSFKVPHSDRYFVLTDLDGPWVLGIYDDQTAWSNGEYDYPRAVMVADIAHSEATTEQVVAAALAIALRNDQWAHAGRIARSKVPDSINAERLIPCHVCGVEAGQPCIANSTPTLDVGKPRRSVDQRIEDAADLAEQAFWNSVAMTFEDEAENADTDWRTPRRDIENVREVRAWVTANAPEVVYGPHDDHDSQIPGCPGCERQYGGE